jgi:molybdate transport system ATP-binding protein
VIALDFALEQGGFLLQVHEQLDARVTVLFGPSGAGKTTILEAIAGLRRPASGRIALNGRDLFHSAARLDLPPHERHVGYVSQDVSLFPHLNVRRNLAYGQRSGGRLDLGTVTAMLEIGALLDRGVGGLSGGEKQRVALGRALMSAPEILLLDEPLAAVDVELRRRILPYLERIRDEVGVPMIYVTHDREEARRFADRVLLLERGAVIGAGTADEVLADTSAVRTRPRS